MLVAKLRTPFQIQIVLVTKLRSNFQNQIAIAKNYEIAIAKNCEKLRFSHFRLEIILRYKRFLKIIPIV